MGVKDLWTILAPVKKHVPIGALKGQTIAVDLSVWVCESLTVKHMQGRVAKPHLRNLFFRVSNLLQLGINMIFVIDGEAPELKWEEMARRQQTRYGAVGGNGKKPPQRQQKKGGRSNFKVWLKECQEMLSHLGIPYVQSKGEAEGMCALLNSEKIADACLTEDGDAFLYGANTVYRNFTLNTKDPHVDCYSMTDIKQELGLDRGKLISLALLLGCDYLPKGVAGVGKEHGCQLMKQLGEVDVLHRFKEWDNGAMDSYIPQHSKPSHCRVCHHVGTGKQHKTQGCIMCGVHIGCTKQSAKDTQCTCSWHLAQDSMEVSKLELDIMRKAIKTAGFPFQPVISEFMDIHDKCPSKSLLHWKPPRLAPLQKFNLAKLEWPEDYTLEKVFPLMTLWHLTNVTNGSTSHKATHRARNNDNLAMEMFVKTRTRQGVACIEVKWVRPDWNSEDEDSHFYNTIEKEELLALAYPDEYEVFKQEIELKKSKTTKGKKKAKTVDPDIAGQSQESRPIDDELVESLMERVQSLDISAVNIHNDMKHPKKTASQLQNDRMVDEEALLGKEYLAEPDVWHGSQACKTSKPKRKTRVNSCTTQGQHSETTKQKRTSDKERLNSCPSMISTGMESVYASVHQISSQSKTQNMLGYASAKSKSKYQRAKSANSSDMNLLEDLLEYEVSQSLRTQNQNAQNGIDTNSTLLNETSMLSDVESEVLPLFQRLQLKSVKGTSEISNSNRQCRSNIGRPQTNFKDTLEISNSNKQCKSNLGRPQANDLRTKHSEGDKDSHKSKLSKTRKPSSQRRREVIVIDSDSDNDTLQLIASSEASLSLKNDKKLLENTTNVAADTVQQSHAGFLTSDTILACSPWEEANQLQEAVSSSQLHGKTLTDSDDKMIVTNDLTKSDRFVSGMIADETVPADYKLIQPESTEVNKPSAVMLSVTASSTLPLVLGADETVPADYKMIQPEISEENKSLTEMSLKTATSTLSSVLDANETVLAGYKFIQSESSGENKSSLEMPSATLSPVLGVDETVPADYKLIHPHNSQVNDSASETLSPTISSGLSSELGADETAQANYKLVQPGNTELNQSSTEMLSATISSTLPSELDADETVEGNYKLIQPNVASDTLSVDKSSTTVVSSESVANETVTADYKLIQPDVTVDKMSSVDMSLLPSASVCQSNMCADETVPADYKLNHPDDKSARTLSSEGQKTTTAPLTKLKTSATGAPSPKLVISSNKSVKTGLISRESFSPSCVDEMIATSHNASYSNNMTLPDNASTKESMLVNETGTANYNVSQLNTSRSEDILTEHSSACSLTNEVSELSGIKQRKETCNNVGTPLCQNGAMSSTSQEVETIAVKDSAFLPSYPTDSVQNYQSPNNTTVSSTNSYWCDDSQMSLFDSPSLVDSIHNFTGIANNSRISSCSKSVSFHNKSKVAERSLVANNSTAVNFSFPSVFDLTTPDIKEETSIHLDSKNGKQIMPKSPTVISFMEKSSKSLMVKEFEQTRVITPNVMELSTPDVLNTIYTDTGMESNQCTKTGETGTIHENSCLHVSTESNTHSVNSNSNQSEEIGIGVSRMVPHVGDITCIPEPLNFDTPDLSLTDTTCGSKVRTPVLSTIHDNRNQTTPLGRNRHVKPHALHMATTPTLTCELTQNVGASKHDQVLNVVNNDFVTKCRDQNPTTKPVNKSKPLSTVRDTVQRREEIENSPVCLMDRLRKKFDKCGDKKATLNAMTSKSQPRL